MAEQYEVVVTNRAEKSLEAIVLYIEENISYSTANKIRLGLLEELEKLELRPEKIVSFNQ